MTVHVLAKKAGISISAHLVPQGCALTLVTVWEQEDYLKERTAANHPVDIGDASQKS